MQKNEIGGVLDQRPEPLGAVAKRFFRALQLGDVFGNADHTVDLAGGVVHRKRPHTHPAGCAAGVDGSHDLVVATVVLRPPSGFLGALDVVGVRRFEELANVFADLEVLSGDPLPDIVQIQDGAGLRVPDPEEVRDVAGQLAKYLCGELFATGLLASRHLGPEMHRTAGCKRPPQEPLSDGPGGERQDRRSGFIKGNAVTAFPGGLPRFSENRCQTTATSASRTSPSSRRTRSSMVRRRSTLSLRNCLAFSRPWPSRSPP